MNAQRYFQIADRELNAIFGKSEVVGDQEIANQCLRHFYSETINMIMFLEATGKLQEYKAWLSRFQKNCPGVDKVIERNIELELEE